MRREDQKLYLFDDQKIYLFLASRFNKASAILSNIKRDETIVLRNGEKANLMEVVKIMDSALKVRCVINNDRDVLCNLTDVQIFSILLTLIIELADKRRITPGDIPDFFTDVKLACTLLSKGNKPLKKQFQKTHIFLQEGGKKFTQRLSASQ